MFTVTTSVTGVIFSQPSSTSNVTMKFGLLFVKSEGVRPIMYLPSFSILTFVPDAFTDVCAGAVKSLIDNPAGSVPKS